METLKEYMNDQTLAVMGAMTVVVIGLIMLMDFYWPIEPQQPKIFKSDPTLKDKSREELMLLEDRDLKLPLMSLEELAKSSGRKGEKAYVACKGVVYDCSENEVYRSDGGYNCFAGKDATIALGKMLFEKSGELGWREKLSHEELCTVVEWASWFDQRYQKVGYLEIDYTLKTVEVSAATKTESKKSN
jgi:membrane-associated progesterone receptor component